MTSGVALVPYGWYWPIAVRVVVPVFTTRVRSFEPCRFAP
jgi:hypothetical protein